MRKRGKDKPLPRTPEIPKASTTPVPESPSLGSKISGWWNRSRTSIGERPSSMYELRPKAKSAVYQQNAPQQYDSYGHYRRGSLVDELSRQSQVFFDDDDFDREEATGTESESAVEETDDEGEMNRRYDGNGLDLEETDDDEEQEGRFDEGGEGWEGEDDTETIRQSGEREREDEVEQKEKSGPTFVGGSQYLSAPSSSKPKANSSRPLIARGDSSFRNLMVKLKAGSKKPKR